MIRGSIRRAVVPYEAWVLSSGLFDKHRKKWYYPFSSVVWADSRYRTSLVKLRVFGLRPVLVHIGNDPVVEDDVFSQTIRLPSTEAADRAFTATSHALIVVSAVHETSDVVFNIFDISETMQGFKWILSAR